MRGLMVVMVAGVLMSAPTSTSAPRQAHVEPTGRIAFSMRYWPEDDRIVDNWEIFVTTLGRAGSVNLTRNPRCSESRPAWSHSGLWIAYACDYGPSAGIGVLSDRGGERRRVVKVPRYQLKGGLAWSPDDRRIAFGARGIWVVNADGSRLRRLTRGKDSWPTWSRNGRMIAFARETRDSTEIRRMRANGTGQRRIAKGFRDPAWAPDGQSIAVVGRNGIWIMRPDGTGRRRLRGTGRATGLAWSPDSQYVAYQVSCCIEAGIYVIGADGTGRRFVAGALEPAGLTWGPDAPELVGPSQ